MTDNELNLTATYIIALASEANAQEKIKLLLTSLLASYQQEGFFHEQKNKQKAVSVQLRFTQQEISKMASTFKKEFIANGLCAHVIKRKSGKKTVCYEIRYRSNGYDISASSTDLNIAKSKFLAKTTSKEIDKYRTGKYKLPENLFRAVFEEWYQYKKGTICDKEHKRFQVNFYSLPKELQNKPIKTAYCLRHTFATICQQYIRPDIVDIWMGDSTTRLVGRVYTHFPDKFMREQMNLVEFPIL